MTSKHQGNLESRKKRALEKAEQKRGREAYVSGTEHMTMDEKKRVLDQIGKPELVQLFQDWKPQIERRRSKKQGPPLDQRVAISVTKNEKEDLQREIDRIKKTGDSSSVSEFIRNRATASIDIIGWREKAEELLDAIDENSKNERKLKRRRAGLRRYLEELDDDPDADNEDKHLYQKELREVISAIESLEVKTKKRAARLSGRMTTPESETIKWRAQRLNLSVSDYLRFCLFTHEPGGEGDAHLSVDAKKRFYIGVIDVATNGWGESPTIHQCKNCIHYRDEAEKYKRRVRDLEQMFVK